MAHGPQVPIQRRQKGVALGWGNNDHVQITNAPISPRMHPIPWRTVFSVFAQPLEQNLAFEARSNVPIIDLGHAHMLE